MSIPEINASVLRVREERERQLKEVPPPGEEDVFDAALLNVAGEAAKRLIEFGEQEAAMGGELTSGVFAVIDAAMTLFEAYRNAAVVELKGGARVIGAEVRLLCAIRLLG